jgi:hypothetical protein
MQREKRERLREKNQEYIEKLKYMISYRESRINEKIKLIERTSTLRETQLRRKAEEREMKMRALKEESQLRNVYFSI